MEGDGPSTHERLVIVGNGMVGHRLCARLTDGRPRGPRSIVVLGEETHPAYDRVHLGRALSLANGDDLQLAPRSWYAGRGIDLRTGCVVRGIDRAARHVVVEGDAPVPYDRLVLATGSRPWVPPIEGIGDVPFHVYRTLDDLTTLRVAARAGRSAVVIGGGLLGLESAKLLVDLGVRVDVVEAAQQIMPRQLDAASASLLARRISEMGVRIHIGAPPVRVSRHAAETRVELADGKALDADLLVVAAGVRPRDELARAAGIACAVRGGIVVDDVLRTDGPRVYAIGECASHRGEIYGLVTPGYRMADVLAAHLSGGRRGRSTRFEGSDRSCHLKLVGVDVSALGAYDVHDRTRAFESEGVRRTLHLEGRRLVGVTAVGPWDELVQVGERVRRRRGVSHRALRRFEATGRLGRQAVPMPVHAWPAATLVCNCERISRGELSRAIDSGCRTVAELADATGASRVCGSCEPLLGELVGAPPVAPRTARALAALSAAAVAIVTLTAVAPPVPVAESVQAPLHRMSALWHEPLPKQISGYALVGLMLLGFVLTVRKRSRWLSRMRFSAARTAHGALGVAALVALVAHTGLGLGENLNRWLALCFIGAAAIGGAAGVASALETRMGGGAPRVARRLRPALSLGHVLTLWPLPVLLVLHVLGVYYF